MKRTVFCIILLALMCACSNLFLDEGPSAEESETQMIADMTKSDANPYFVTEDDIRDYIRFKALSENQNVAALDITPYCGEPGIICFYIINYSDGGWDVIAADKRYDLLVAHNPLGCFEWDDLIPPIKDWMETLAEEVLFFRSQQDQKLFSKEDLERVSANLLDWEIITGKTISNSKDPQTKGQFDPDGYWEIVSIQIDTLESHFVDHLIQTHWKQDAPYNVYCPYKSYSNTLHAPAGCVAIAGAQVAYYLNDKIGLPQTAPLTAFCDAQVPQPINDNQFPYSPTTNDPHMNVSNFSSSAWALMVTSDDYVAKLIAQIGIDVSMAYYNNGSSALLYDSTNNNLMENYFIANGISCSYLSIVNSTLSTLYDNLLNDIPVIAGASNSSNTSAPHAFIIDGCDYKLLRFTTHYTWIPSSPNSPTYDDRIEVDDRISAKITMNWGLGNSLPYDSGWYSPLGTWQVNGNDYSSYKYMICNFDIL